MLGSQFGYVEYLFRSVLYNDFKIAINSYMARIAVSDSEGAQTSAKSKNKIAKL